MKVSPAWTLQRLRRRVDGGVDASVRLRGGRLLQVHVDAAESSGPGIVALIEAAIAGDRRPAAFNDWG